MSALFPPPRLMVIACATVVEELRPVLPSHVGCQRLDFGLHVKPESLKQALQEAFDDIPPPQTSSCSATASALKPLSACDLTPSR